MGQSLLGGMYWKGEGVKKDHVEAHKWSNISLANGNEHAREKLAIIQKGMKKKQIEKAQRLAREWMETHN